MTLNLLALCLAVVLVVTARVSYTLGRFRGIQQMRATCQGQIDALILDSEGRERDLLVLKGQCAAIAERQQALLALAGQSANREPA